jgi:hypothetical protein
MREETQNQMWGETQNVPGSINGIPKWDPNDVNPNWDLPLGEHIVRSFEEWQNSPPYPDIGSNPSSKWDTNGNGIPDYLPEDQQIEQDPPWRENESEDVRDIFEELGKAIEDNFDSDF